MTERYASGGGGGGKEGEDKQDGSGKSNTCGRTAVRESAYQQCDR